MFQKRILSYIIDMGIFMLIVWFLGILMIVSQFVLDGDAIGEVMYYIMRLVSIVSILGVILKDIILRKRSVGKKIMGLKIVTKDGNEPKLYQLIVRNVFSLVWIVEAVLLLLGKERIGDRVAKTIVIEECDEDMCSKRKKLIEFAKKFVS